MNAQTSRRRGATVRGHQGGCACGGSCQTVTANAGASPTSRSLWQYFTSGEGFFVIAGAVLFALGLMLRTEILSSPVQGFDVAVLLAAYLLTGKNVLKAAATNIVRGRFLDENFLMTVASGGAALIGELPEATGVMLFYAVGERLQEAAVARSRRSIRALIDLRPDFARVESGPELAEVEAEEVNPGQIIVVRPGEKIPLDGRVIAGESFIDTSTLTGEPTPVRVGPGGEVLAGAINKSGLLRVEVTRPFTQTSLAKITELVERANERKSRTEQFITRFARYYTPAILAAAAALAVLPPLVMPDASFAEWLHRALILLVISCPCALVISIPLGYFGGVGGASRRGILVKGANYLDALSKVETVVFDKTGTLTEGVFEVNSIQPSPGFARAEVLKLAAAVEANSNHPIAASIVKAAGSLNEVPQVKDYQEIAGRGAKADVAGKSVVVGNRRMLEQEGIRLLEGAGQKSVLVAVDGRLAGEITVSDRVRAGARQAVEDLQHLGVSRTVLLTGDSTSAGAEVAQALGIREVHSGLLPEDKVAKLEAIMEERRPGQKVVFVGDGINDAPVITRADVGVAMGGLGSDAAVEAADVVIMEDKPEKMAEAVRVARFTRRVVIQNIVLALAVKGLVILLAAAGAASMWQAVFADVGVAILAVLNATRVLRTDGKGAHPGGHPFPVS